MLDKAISLCNPDSTSTATKGTPSDATVTVENVLPTKTANPRKTRKKSS